MTDLERGDLFDLLREVSQHYPHWRLGQLMLNITGWADADVWDVENDQLLAAVRKHLEQLHLGLCTEQDAKMLT